MAGNYPKTEFQVHLGDHSETVTADQLNGFAELYGIDRLIPGRYSHLFLLNLYSMEKHQGIPPDLVTQEIKSLEQGSQSYMKPETPYKRKPLRGLWHKHFFASLPSTVAHNLSNELGRRGVRQAVETAFHPSKGDRVTPEMISDLVSAIVEKPFQKRSDEGRLTGEWIVYAKHRDQNYYLCISSHKHGDDAIAGNLRTVCCREFEWLADIMDSE